MSEYPLKLYRPSNGTEGELFMAAFCARCANDKNHDCRILAKSMAFGVSDDDYPPELQYDSDDEPCCTAFEPTERETFQRVLDELGGVE